MGLQRSTRFCCSSTGKGNAVFHMNKRLTENPKLIDDSVPDIFTVTISSLKILRNRYGGNSLQAQGAVILLKALLPKMATQFAELYHGNSVVEILTLEWQGHLSEKYPDAMQHVYQHVQPHLHSQSVEMFQHHLPRINLRDDLDDLVKESLCSSLHSKLLNIQPRLKIDCLVSHHR